MPEICFSVRLPDGPAVGVTLDNPQGSTGSAR